jgi:outer membrane protein assembly factor BamB
MTRRVLAVVIVFIAAGLTGCDKPVNVLSHLIAQPETVAELGYNTVWQTNLGLKPGDRVLYAQLLGDRLVTLESGNILSSIDVHNGKILWRTKVSRETERFSKPVRDGNNLVFASETRAFVFDINDGNRLRVIPLKFVSTTTPVVFGGLMILGSPTGIVFAQDLDQGLLRWHIQTGGAVTVNPQMVGATLLVANRAGVVTAFNPRTGAILWTKRTFAAISAVPQSTENFVYIASQDQSIYALQRTTGKQRWRYFAQEPLIASPMVAGDLLLQQVPGTGLVALNAFSGQVAWTRQWPNAVALFAKDATIYFWDRNRFVEVDSKTGKDLKIVDFPAVHYVVVDDANPRNIYLLRVDGPIMKITPR